MKEVINDAERIREFYSIFINAIAQITIQHKGKNLKTIGDGVISYFPQTNDPTKIAPFREVGDNHYQLRWVIKSYQRFLTKLV